ncbi:DUF2924 domain-containing protein [Brevundimonas sp.]|uniref:DUF2924 domain-containing protein n=1 Tax=Brevundimonas sp. TaxID=1871086 RepID=UPI003F6ED2F3
MTNSARARPYSRPLDVDHANLDVVLARIEAADRPALLRLWAGRWEKKAPSCLSLEKLRRLISYRLQQQRLDPTRSFSEALQAPLSITCAPEVFRRTWRGAEHTVLRTAQGFIYEGAPYRSLSAVARTITGTQWNGLAFFSAQHLKRRPRPERSLS